ncbi:MAG: CoB--CoM heterodisulfide reductase iron-sulfur subunit B family protein [Anaerolineae bacterium]
MSMGAKGLRYAYYPGCSLETTAKEYDRSWRAVAEALNITLEEIPDWNCCGASPVHIQDPRLAAALPARNLALAEAMGADVVAPCVGCYKNLRKAAKETHQDATLRQQVGEAVGREFRGTVQVKHPVEVLLLDVGLEAIRERVVRPLQGLKVAPYYGCYLTRPDSPFDTAENPQSLDRLMEAIGAEPVPYPLKTRCCGGGIFLTREEMALEMSHRLLTQARRSGADCMVVACPLCDMLLDAYQGRVEAHLGVRHGMPVLYFSQLMGLALGVEEKRLGFEARFVSPEPVLAKLRVAASSG